MCVCECACGRMSVFMCGCFIQNISLCAWSVLTLAQGTRSVDKNCLVRVPRHEKWIWTKKCRLTAQAKSWQAQGVVVGSWRVVGKGRGWEGWKPEWKCMSEWAAWREIVFLMKHLPRSREQKIANYIWNFPRSNVSPQTNMEKGGKN